MHSVQFSILYLFLIYPHHVVLDTDMMLDENVVLFSQGFINVALCSTGVLTL